MFEKLKCNRLVDLLEKKKVFFDNQFGFRAKHSTDHAVLSIVKIQRANDERDISCGVFLLIAERHLIPQIMRYCWKNLSSMAYVALQIGGLQNN